LTMIISRINFYVEYVHNIQAASLFLDASLEIFILSSDNSFWSAKHNSTALHCKMRHEYSVITFAGPYNGALQRFYHLSESHNIHHGTIVSTYNVANCYVPIYCGSVQAIQTTATDTNTLVPTQLNIHV
jgi:hypothetical protein